MRFLLVAVNAKYIHSNPAIYSLRAYAGKRQAQENFAQFGQQPVVELAEYTINQRLQDILADIYKKKPDAIGFSCYIWNWNYIQELLCEIPKLLPDTSLWLGGPEVSFHGEKILDRFPQVTGIMVGEGEETFWELLKYYSAQGPAKRLEEIKGLYLKAGFTGERELINLDELPFLYDGAWSLDGLDSFENKIIYYESSRGCPYRCSYCLSALEKKLRLRSMEVVKKELQFFLDKRVKQVKFIDRTFNCNHDHAMQIWNYILEHDNGVTNFHFEIAADILRQDEIDLLHKMRPGLVQLEIGVQSVNPDTIREINRVMNVEQLEQIVASIDAGKNIHQHLDLIAGLPYEDYNSFAHSFDRVYSMHPEQLQLGFLKVLKGSYMENRADDYGLVYMDRAPYEVLYTKWLSYEDVLRLKKIEEMVEIYYNSNQFTHTLPVLETCFQSPFKMFEELAAFYEKNGFFTESPARAYRYRILYDFILEKDRVHQEVYRELLVYDMYLRENLKSRPSFATDWRQRADVATRIRDFFRMEEQSREYLPDYTEYDGKQLSKMTHMEPFHYPVWKVGTEVFDGRVIEDIRKTDKKHTEEVRGYVLFDYKNRNPLTYEARTCIFEKLPQ